MQAVRSGEVLAQAALHKVRFCSLLDLHHTDTRSVHMGSVPCALRGREVLVACILRSRLPMATQHTQVFLAFCCTCQHLMASSCMLPSIQVGNY